MKPQSKYDLTRCLNPISIIIMEAFKTEAELRKGNPGECWAWDQRSVEQNIYPLFKRTRVHRLSCDAFVGPGPTPEKPWVLHSCDNPWCWNPEHLRYGSPKENLQDAVDRGRWTGAWNVNTSYRLKPEQYARGEKIHFAKLTEESVREIRRAYAQGTSQVELGKQYGVAAKTISKIVCRRTWKHVN